jgi:arginyl-tRNA synthetase
MSSRKGNILSGPDLLEEIKKQVNQIVEKRENFSEETKEDVAEKVTIAAVKYSFLKSNILQNMVFDIKESVSFDGNSGPYILYVYARIQSVLNQNTSHDSTSLSDLKTLDTPEELKLIKLLERFPEKVRSAGDTYSPHIISNYVFEVAGLYNTFYKMHSINNAKDETTIKARRLLSEKTAITIKNSLRMLGIDVVDSM